MLGRSLNSMLTLPNVKPEYRFLVIIMEKRIRKDRKEKGEGKRGVMKGRNVAGLWSCEVNALLRIPKLGNVTL